MLAKLLVKYQTQGDTYNVRRVESAMVNAIINNPKPHPALIIFYLCNRDPERWLNPQRVEITGKGGEAIPIIVRTNVPRPNYDPAIKLIEEKAKKVLSRDTVIEV